MVILMNITKSPQFQIYLLTLHLMNMKDSLLPENCDIRCVDATIINRAYFSAYLYCELWLWIVHHFRIKHPWEFEKGQKRDGEHKQVRTALYDFGEDVMQTELENLAKLRNKADYYPHKKISPEDISNAIDHMETIFNHLKF